ncbi:MAG: hypothetical protein E5V95_35610, partial [Mesorhizobium sp.]
MPILSDNYVKSAVLPAGRDELIIRDSKLSGFALRLRRKADGKSSSKTWLVFQELPMRDGKRKRRKIIIGDFSV